MLRSRLVWKLCASYVAPVLLVALLVALGLPLPWSALLAAIAALALAAWSARRLTRPLDAMTEAADAMRNGGLRRAIAGHGADEFDRLAAAVDGMAQDLQGRVEALTGDRNKVLAILASMVEGVVAVDRGERVVHMNEVAERLLGASPGQAAGRRIWEVTRASGVCELLEATLREEGEAAGELVLRVGTDPAERRIEMRSSPLRDAAGEVAGAVVVLHDVSELRRLEEVRRDFVANVSHELKTPLTAIRGLVETLLDDRHMEEATRVRFLEKIRDQSSRLSTLVSDLLTLARIESPEEPIERRTLDLRSPVREGAARFAPLCQHKGLEMRLELPERAVLLRGDEEALRQIVDNLLDNAVKYTPSGGRVRLRLVAPASDGGPERWALLEVEDTGIGIEPRHQERIFERFYRVDKARSRELGGTGLGLSIVKHLALAHGGRVSLESTPGRGSTFRVHLPSPPPAA
ncbi:MAG TPA: ATP-binding protein [Planctomycetota bacterium]|nr:ATP-binding protein [Planctomycetota bacterium]